MNPPPPQKTKIAHIPLEDVLAPFEILLKKATFYNQDLRPGTLEVRFGDAETAHEASLNIVEGGK